MFATLRKFVIPGVIIAITFFLALIVGEWGLDLTGRSQAGNPEGIAAIINGEKISVRDYDIIFRNMYQNEAQDSDADLSDSRVRQIENAAWQQLLQDRLLSQEVRKHNIIVTDKDLFAYLQVAPPQYLQNSPSFQTDGQFDYQKYLNAMADPSAAPFWSSIEPAIRSDVEKLKLQQLIIQTAQVSESEIKQSVIDSTETISVDMILVPYEKYSPDPPSDEEIRAFYEENKDKYQRKERAILNFVKLTNELGDGDWDIAEFEAQRLYDSIQAGADFSELATLYSDDPASASNGGDLGWFARGRMVAEFDELSFSLEEGSISAPFKTSFGYHIIKHLGYRTDNEIPPGKSKKEDVRKAHVSHILVKAVVSEDSKDAKAQRLEDFAIEASTNGFEEAAESAGLSVNTTLPFEQGTFIREIDGFIDGLRFAEKAKIDEVSPIYYLGEDIYVIQLVEKIPAGIGSFDEVKVNAQIDLVRKTIEQICVDTVTAIYSEIQSGVEMKAAAKKYGVDIQSFADITRGRLSNSLRRDPKAIGGAFSLKDPGQITPPIGFSGGGVVFSFVNRTEPDLTSFSEKRDSVLQVLTISKQRELYQNWYENLIEESEIENFISDLRAGI